MEWEPFLITLLKKTYLKKMLKKAWGMYTIIHGPQLVNESTVLETMLCNFMV